MGFGTVWYEFFRYGLWTWILGTLEQMLRYASYEPSYICYDYDTDVIDPGTDFTV
jgi:hypothetical protein